jgi:PAS domain S-box-containing protein
LKIMQRSPKQGAALTIGIMNKSTAKANQGEKPKKKEIAVTEELNESETRYRRLFESTKEGVLILDAKTGKIVDVNPFLIDLLGYSKQNLIEKSIWEIGAFQDIYENKEKFLELQQKEYVRYEDLPLVASDGREIHVEFVSNVYSVNNKKVIQCNIRDISIRKSKEDSLKEKHHATDASLNALLNLMQAPILIWDFSMIIKRFNHKFELLSGYHSDEVIDKKIDFLFPKEKVAATLELLKNHLDDEHLEVVEIDILTKDNQIKTVLWDSSHILDEDGKTIIATISQDITSRRQSELALRKSESHLRTLVSTIPDLIWLKDTKGVYLSCNPMFERFFGAKETEIIGKTDYDFVDRELADFFRKNDQKAMEAGKPTSNEEWVTFADGGRRAFLETIKTPMYDSDGTLFGVLGIGRDITERKLAGQVLQASEERFRAIFDQAPIAFAMLDMQGHPIMSNLRFLEMVGYTKDELAKLKFTEFTYPEDIDKDLLQFTDLITGKISGYSMEKRYIHKNGNLIWANLFVTALNDSNGEPQEIIGMVEDITEQKKIHNEIKFQADLLNNVGQSVIATDLSGKVIYWNKAAEKIYGWSTSEAIGESIVDLIQPSEEQANDNMKTLSTGKTWAGEFDVKRKDGSSFPVFGTNTPIHDPNGKLNGFIGISSDISERKQIQKKIKDSEEQFRSITENSADAIFITDKEGKYIYVNKQAVDLLGYSKEELLAFTIADITPKNRMEAYSQIFQQLFITGSSYSEIEMVKKDGSIADTDLNAVLLPNGWIYGSCRDISKRKKLEKELIKSKERAEESDRLKSAFLANMSHEIRTPMNGILGFTELLKEHDLSGDDQQEYIRIIEKSGDRMLNIINDIISISKIESQQIEVSVSETNVNEQIDYIYNFFKLEAEQKNLQISFKKGLPDKEARIETDHEKVYAVLTNLVKNAIKFTQKGSIEFGYLKKDGFLEFYVKDSGSGVRPEQKYIIFERFRQGSESLTRNYEGAGLGLSISKAYVEMLGGKIRVENNASNNGNASGVTFYFTLPALPIKEKSHVPQVASPDNSTINEIGKLNILIVEDDKYSQLLLIELLEGVARKILKAITGIEAVKFCRENPDIDLVLMDINMPEMDGYEATRQIREFNKDVVIIAQTAYALSGDREKSIAAGCNTYITKPINRVDLGTLINKYFSELAQTK